MLYNPEKKKYVPSNHEHTKKHTGVWKRDYRRGRLKGKHGRYYLRVYKDGRKMVSFQFYDESKGRVTNTVEIGEWEDVRWYRWYMTQRKGKRDFPAEYPAGLCHEYK